MERVQAGTPGITGTFDLSFSGREIRGLPADVSADTLKQLLNANYPNEGGTESRLAMLVGENSAFYTVLYILVPYLGFVDRIPQLALS